MELMPRELNVEGNEYLRYGRKGGLTEGRSRERNGEQRERGEGRAYMSTCTECP